MLFRHGWWCGSHHRPWLFRSHGCHALPRLPRWRTDNRSRLLKIQALNHAAPVRLGRVARATRPSVHVRERLDAIETMEHNGQVRHVCGLGSGGGRHGSDRVSVLPARGDEPRLERLITTVFGFSPQVRGLVLCAGSCARPGTGTGLYVVRACARSRCNDRCVWAATAPEIVGTARDILRHNRTSGDDTGRNMHLPGFQGRLSYENAAQPGHRGPP
ncbi:CBS domain-containing protein [Nocardia sp. GAS34]